MASADEESAEEDSLPFRADSDDDEDSDDEDSDDEDSDDDPLVGVAALVLVPEVSLAPDGGGASSADGAAEVTVGVDRDADSLGVTGLGDADVDVTDGALDGAELLGATDGGAGRVGVITGSKLGATGSGARVLVGA